MSFINYFVVIFGINNQLNFFLPEMKGYSNNSLKLILKITSPCCVSFPYGLTRVNRLALPVRFIKLGSALKATPKVCLEALVKSLPPNSL